MCPYTRTSAPSLSPPYVLRGLVLGIFLALACRAPMSGGFRGKVRLATAQPRRPQRVGHRCRRIRRPRTPGGRPPHPCDAVNSRPGPGLSSTASGGGAAASQERRRPQRVGHRCRRIRRPRTPGGRPPHPCDAVNSRPLPLWQSPTATEKEYLSTCPRAEPDAGYRCELHQWLRCVDSAATRTSASESTGQLPLWQSPTATEKEYLSTCPRAEPDAGYRCELHHDEQLHRV